MDGLSQVQLKANERIAAWLYDQPYEEYPGARPRVPKLKPEFVLRTYTPPCASWGEQYFTPLEAGAKALADTQAWMRTFSGPATSILEPCAGIGHLVCHCLSVFPGAKVEAFEIEAMACKIGYKLFPAASWNGRNSFDAVDYLSGQFDLVVCNPPFGGGDYLLPQDKGMWHAKGCKSEYWFLELAARALVPGGTAVFIAPQNFSEGVPPKLKAYFDTIGFSSQSSGATPLPGQFLQTGVRVYDHRFIRL